MRTLRIAVLAMMALAATALAQSQGSQQAEPAPGAPPAQPQSKRLPRVVTASPEMQKLQFMIGEWRTAETFAPSDWAPKGGTGNGRARVRWGAGKKFMLENYMSRNQAFGPFAGQATFWYDQKAKAYRSFWCDGMMGCEDSFGSGHWDGDRFIVEGEHEFEGKKMKARLTVYDIKPDSFGWMEETSMDGGPMKKSMSIQYTRAAGGARAAEPPETKPENKK